MKVIRIILAIIASSAMLACQPRSAPPKNESPLEWFARMDRNQDGKLSYTEVPSPRFKELDTDNDGFVTQGEYSAYLNRQAIKQLDRDKDGKISQTEFNALYQNADAFFANRQKLAQPADGRPLLKPFPVKDDPLGLRFTQDYFPGTKDPQGRLRLIAATEANHLAAHRGQLFASFGATYRKPPTPDPDFFLSEFFGQQFHGGGKYLGPIRAAYNPFTAITDPRSGKTIHLAGLQVYHPGFHNPPHNGSRYLIRYTDGRYDWGAIFDPAHPVPVGKSLDATRRILLSPFPEDQGRVLYFAGYEVPSLTIARLGFTGRLCRVEELLMGARATQKLDRLARRKRQG